MTIMEEPSPNSDDRPDGMAVDTVVLHATVLPTLDQVIEHFRNPENKVSAHYTIDRDGTIASHVAESRRAWHAGKSKMKDGRTGVNDFSIGIELVNLNDGQDPFPPRQITALRELLSDIIARQPIRQIVTHYECADPPGRKSDPAGFQPSWVDGLLPRRREQPNIMAAMHLPERLRSGPPVIATFSMIASPEIVQLLATAGFESVVLDMEHGPLDFSTLNVLIPAARAAGIHPIVRVRNNEASLISSALDVGAAGVLVPQIDSGTAAASVVTAARFKPLGHRGVNPYTRAAGFHANRNWFESANSEVAVMVMVEGKTGITNLQDILTTPGIDAIFIGPFDLSQALGVAGQVDHPSVLQAVETIVTAAAARNVATAVFAPTPALARRWLLLGVQMVALGYDTALALEGFRTARQSVI